MRMAAGTPDGAADSRNDQQLAPQRTRRGADTIGHLAELSCTFTLCGDNPDNAKAPRGTGWNLPGNGHPAATAVAHLAGNGSLAGIVTGDPSNGTIVLDADQNYPRFVREHPELCTLTVTRSNAPDRGKVILRLDGTVPSGRKYKRTPKSKPFFELLAAGATEGSGCNAIVAGTFQGPDDDRPSVYELHGEQPATVSTDELHAIVSQWTGDTRAFTYPAKPETSDRTQGADATAQRGQDMGADAQRQGKAKTPEMDPATFAAWCQRGGAWLTNRHGSTERIKDGELRRIKLIGVAGWLRYCGLSGTDAVQVTKELNRQHCDPPVGDWYFRGMANRLDTYRVGRSDPTVALAELKTISAAAAETPWKGRKGLSEQRLLNVFLKAAQRVGSLLVGLSDRDAATEAGFADHQTAGKARHRLIAAGWLFPIMEPKRKGFSDRGRSQTYRLQTPPGYNRPLKEQQRGSGQVVLYIPLLTADRWRRDPVGLEIVTELDTGAVYPTAAALAKAINLPHGRNADTVRHRLKALVADWLVVKRRDGWQRGPATLEPTFTKRDADRIRRRAERVLHHDNMRRRGIEPDVQTPIVTFAELQAAGVVHRNRKLVAALIRRKLLPDYRDTGGQLVLVAATPTRKTPPPKAKPVRTPTPAPFYTDAREYDGDPPLTPFFDFAIDDTPPARAVGGQ